MNKTTIEKAINHLSKIKEFQILIDKNPIPTFNKNDNYFDALSKSIIYQQLSGKVAKIIYHRFISLFKQNSPNAKECLKLSIKDLKGIGLSRQKISYINNLSEFLLKTITSLILIN